MATAVRILGVLVVVLIASRVEGQTPAELPAFEVISIKPRTGDTPVGGIPNAPDRFVRPNVSVSQLIELAYRNARKRRVDQYRGEVIVSAAD